MKALRIALCIVFAYILNTSGTYAGIDIEINSNNPRIPFPQFLDYTQGKTLGRDNAIGVTDIEMERDIREAYQIMMNRASYEGTVVAGTKYIIYNKPGLGGGDGTGPEPDVSEGDGYALLAMAYMADKKAFDGLYMYVHDHKASKVEYFSKCGQIRNSAYQYGAGSIGWRADGISENPTPDCSDCNSAADGDFDIAMALLIAYYQWPNDGIVDDCGNKRLYKDLTINYLKTITDTLFFDINDGHTDRSLSTCSPGSDGWYSGDIGFDGYIKSGNTWAEVTRWGQGYQWNGYTFCPRANGESSKHIDYSAPSYFKAFADFLVAEDSTQYAWNINQFRRAETSCDWLMGQVYDQGLYPTAGNYALSYDGSSATFSEMNFAEDSRHPWRTILNYVWHDNPKTTWNPTTHEPELGGNTFEYDNAIRLAKRIDFSNECYKLGQDPTELKFSGVALMTDNIGMDGSIMPGMGKHINYNLGSCAPAVVAYHKKEQTAQSKDLLADWYRQCVMLWDATDENQPFPDSRYILSLPKYFHGWFRLLGLLVTTGNYQSPVFMSKPQQANLKIYNQTDKTLAYAPKYVNGKLRKKGDTITYTFSYRNYAAVEAKDVKISFDLPTQVSFLEASDNGALSGNTVEWDIGSIPGYQSTGETGADWDTFDPTKYDTYGEVTLKVQINQGTENSIINSQATITASNSAPHTSNEYPNNYSTTMERNCVDISTRSLEIVTRANRTVVNDGDVIDFNIEFSNSTDVGWLNGGRPGVRVTYGGGIVGTNTIVNYYRLLHGADEAYINPGNYRISYFINDAARIGILGPGNDRGWYMFTSILEGAGKKEDVKFSSQEYTFGEDQYGKWNQRLIVTLPDTIIATTQNANMFFAKPGEPNDVLFLHRGIGAPFRMRVDMEAKGAPGSGCGSIPVKDLLTDDWSYTDKVDVGSDDKSMFTPISPGWFDIYSTYDESLQTPIDKYHPDACNPIVSQTFDRVLVEEWDGYIWRRILGKGPVPGRELENVYIYDTLPDDLEWQGFIKQEALGVKATYDPVTRVISWTVPSMLPGASGRIAYAAKAIIKDCSKDIIAKNSAWIGSDSDSPIDSTLDILITCDDVIPYTPSGSTIYKTADKTKVGIDDEVTYTISFAQSDGTISEPDMSSVADWTVHCGDPLTDFENLKNRTFTYDYSHGTNGTLEATVVPKIAQPFSLVFRHNSNGSGCGSGLELQMTNSNCSQLTLKLYENGTLIDERENISYAAPADTMAIKIELEDDHLNLWVNNFSALPYVMDQITYTDPGYVGFKNASNELHKLIYWRTNFDSGFEVSLEDKIPSNLELLAGSQKVLYDQSGTYTNPLNFDNTTNMLSWVLVENKEPMLFMDSVSFEFKTKVTDCGPSKYTNNVALAHIKGQSLIVDAAPIECSDMRCVLPTKVSISPASDTILCGGISIAIATTTNGADTYNFSLYNDTKKIETNDNGNYLVTQSGNYFVLVTDPKDEANCIISSDTIKITIVDDPSIAITTEAIHCVTDSSVIKAEFTANDLTGIPTWYINDKATSMSAYHSYEIQDNGTLLKLHYELEGCTFKDSIELNKKSVPIPNANPATYSILKGETNPGMKIIGTESLAWFSTDKAYQLATPIETGGIYTSPETNEGLYTYYFAQKDADGCWSLPSSLTFQIVDCAIDPPAQLDTAICIVGGKAQLDLAGIESLLQTTADSYSWTDQLGKKITLDQQFVSSGTVTLLVAGYDNTKKCYGPQSPFTIKVNEEPSASVSIPSQICHNTETSINANPASGTWEFTIGNKQLSSASIAPSDLKLGTSASNVALAYNYTDDVTGCKAEGTASFSVFLPSAPKTEDASANEQDMIYPPLKASAISGRIVWYESDCTDSIGSGESFKHGFTKTQTAFAAEIVDGCKSECSPATFTLNACAVQPPVISGTKVICEGDNSPVFSIVKPNATYTYTWTTGNLAVQTKGTSFSFSDKKAGTYSVSVTADDGSCISSATAQELKIISKPSVSITPSIPACWGTSIDVALSPEINNASSVLIGTTPVSVTNNSIDLAGFDAGTYQMTYKYELGNCSDQATNSIEIIKTASPRDTAYSEILANATGMLSVRNKTGDIQWYLAPDLQTPAGSGYVHTHTPINQEGSWVYKVTRTENGCTSEPGTITFEINNCPVPAPSIQGTATDSVCAGNTVTLSATPATGNTWYLPDGSKASGGTYTTSALSPGTYTYRATTTDGCEGINRTYTLTVPNVPTPTVNSPANTNICDGEDIPQFSFSGNKYSPAWYIGSTLQNTGNFLSVSPNEYSIGTNTYSLIVTEGTIHCPSPAQEISFTVSAVPSPPQATSPQAICQEEASAPATIGANGTVHWYYDTDNNDYGLTEIPGSEGNTSFIPTPLIAGDANTVFVSQIENGCESKAVQVDFAVNALPEKPSVSDKSQCHNTHKTDISISNWKSDYIVEWKATSAQTWNNETGGTIPTQQLTESTDLEIRFVDKQSNCASKLSSISYSYIEPPIPTLAFKQGWLCRGSEDEDLLTAEVTVGTYSGIIISEPSGNENRSESITIRANENYVGSYTAQTYTSVDGNNCYSNESTPVVFELKDAIAAPSFSPIQDYCQGTQSPILQATPANSGDALYLYKESSPYLNGAIPDIATGEFALDDFISANGTQTFYLVAENGCRSLPVTVRFEIYPKPYAPSIAYKDNLHIEPGNILVCQGDDAIPDIIAQSNSGTTIEWTDVNGKAVGLGSDGEATLIAPKTENDSTYTYFIEASTENGCTADTIIKFEVKPLPQPVLKSRNGNTEKDIICIKTQQQFYTIENYDPGNKKYSIGVVNHDFGNEDNIQYITQGLKDLNPIIVRPLSVGTDTIFLTETLNGCTNTGYMEVSVVDATESDFSYYLNADIGNGTFNNKSVIENLETGEENQTKFVWSFDGDTVNQSYESFLDEERIVKNLTPGNHEIILHSYNQGGEDCEDKIRKDITMKAITSLYVPTAFSPTSEGRLVKQWKPAGRSLEKYEVWIFDNWGNIVWYSNKLKDGQPAEGWNGTDLNGNPVLADTYIYKIKATFSNGEKWKNKDGKELGNILMIR